MEWVNDIGISFLWLIAGMALIALEVLVLGIGLAFAGLAAIVVGVIVALGLLTEDAHIAQFAVWFGVTAIAAWLLWKPLKRWRTSSKEGGEYSNIVGGTATVIGGDLVRGKTGKAKWSGTVMNAEIDASYNVDVMRDGEAAEIVSVDGITLKLRPK